jgi:hypothetical protein
MATACWIPAERPDWLPDACRCQLQNYDATIVKILKQNCASTLQPGRNLCRPKPALITDAAATLHSQELHPALPIRGPAVGEVNCPVC